MSKPYLGSRPDAVQGQLNEIEAKIDIIDTVVDTINTNNPGT